MTLSLLALALLPALAPLIAGLCQAADDEAKPFGEALGFDARTRAKGRAG